jgi:hypothetical protein
MRLSKLVVMVALGLSTFAVACSGSDSGGSAVGEDDLTSGVTVGTYVVDSPPLFGGYYTSRLTLSAGKKFEAEMVSDGATTLIAGSYDILPARPNNPQSPVLSDKPTLYLSGNSGNVTFELDKLPDGGLKLYHSVRSVSFTVKKDPSWQPQPTNAKVINCTGPAVNAKITLDQAQGKRGTLTITRKAAAGGRSDPPNATVSIIKVAGSEVPGYVYFEGSKGEQDYYVNMNQDDFERGTGPIKLHLQWAEGGEQFDVGATCAFTR